jgi:hypothetical protein
VNVPWWLVPYWLDLELARYLAACEYERTNEDEEVTMADNRTQQDRLHAKHGGLNRNPNDAQKQGKAGQPKR